MPDSPARPARRASSGVLARQLRWLPRGDLLAGERWAFRHRMLVRLLWAHALGVFLVASALRRPVWQAVAEGAILAAPAALAVVPWFHRRVRSAIVAIGLVTASAIVIQLADGAIEAHFHCFVMVAFLSLYQDWIVVGLAVLFVVLQHGLMGSLDPESVYNHDSAIRHPWLWACIHGGAVLASALASVVTRRVVEDQALHDDQTGLATRSMLNQRAAKALARRDGGVVGMLYLDLDDFKTVNDRLGRSAGDRVLVQVARRLEAAVRNGDVVSRVGGDEFVILLHDLGGDAEAVKVAERIQRALAEPFELPSGPLSVGGSLGVATGAATDTGLDELLRNSDLAMYAAKNDGRGGTAVFEPCMHQAVVERATLEQDVRRAFARSELALHYQPIVDLRTGAMTGVEALVRWNHPERGLVTPAAFLDIVQSAGMMPSLTRWVLAEACGWIAARRVTHPGERLVVSVNVTPADLLEPGLVELVGRTLAQHDLEGGRLCVEVTETAVLDDIEASRPVLVALRALGVSIAMDDFGTGYSSLSHMRQLPLDKVKIDRSFVQGLGVHTGDSAVVGALVGLAHSLGFAVVAEGVETHGQVEALRELGCEYIQGFLIARPTPAEELPVPAEVHRRLGDAYAPAAVVAAVPCQRGAARRTDPRRGPHRAAMRRW